MSHILGVGRSLGRHRYSQHELTDAFARATGLDEARTRLLARLHRNCDVEYRHLALPVEQYPLPDFGTANDAFITTGSDLAIAAVDEALSDAGIPADDVDLLLSASSTGFAVPSLEARIAGPLKLRSDVKRIPLVGLGCAAGAAGLARVHDYLRGAPGETAVLVCTELCSLTYQPSDASVPNLIGSGLFGDGAGAVVLTADDPGDGQSTDRLPVGGRTQGSGPRVIATGSQLYSDTQRLMGWDVSGAGLKIVLGAEIPALIKSSIADDVEQFLAGQGLARADIGWWVCHPGGPKVLEALQDALDIEPAALQHTWTSLANIGNISSASVLHILAETLDSSPPAPGSYGLMMALGPGFALELVLLEA
jgi:alkylresorcinol/alkylpyrone synthase